MWFFFSLPCWANVYYKQLGIKAKVGRRHSRFTQVLRKNILKQLHLMQLLHTPFRIWVLWEFSTFQQNLLMLLHLVTCSSPFPLTEGFADVGHSLEDAVRKIDLDLHVLHVGQLQAQQLVLGCKKEPGVSLDAIFVQCPVGFEQPCLLLLPPQSMVWPVLLHICKQEKEKRDFWCSLTLDKWGRDFREVLPL